MVYSKIKTLYENISLKQQIALFAGVMMFSFFWFGGQASAATINVTANASDVAVNGNCSIHEAVEAARTDSVVDACTAGSGADTVNLPDGVYNLAPSSVNLNLGQESIILNGASRAGTIIDGTGGYGMTYDTGTSGFEVTLSNLTVRNSSGLASNSEVNADLTITNTLWYNNEVSGSNAVIDVDGADNGEDFTFSNSIMHDNIGYLVQSGSSQGFDSINFSNLEFYDNEFASGGSEFLVAVRSTDDAIAHDINFHDNAGGLSLYSEQVTVYDVVFSGNEFGFGITPSNSDSVVTVYNTSVIDNSGQGALSIASDAGGYEVDIYNITVAGNGTTYPALFFMSDEDTPLSGNISNITVANNNRVGNVGMTVPAGMAIMVPSAIDPTVVLTNVLFANNTDEGTTPRNCVPAGGLFYAWVSGGGNLSSDNSCASIHNQSSDQNNVNPQIDSIELDGGMWVIPLLSNSPAINEGITLAGITSDQRGTARPQGSGYDIGAYEFSGSSNPDPDPDPDPDPTDPSEPGSGGSSAEGSNQGGTNGGLAKTGVSIAVVTLVTLAVIASVLTYLKLSNRKMAWKNIRR